MSLGENGITNKPEFVELGKPEIFSGIVQILTPETYKVIISGPDNENTEEHLIPEIATAAEIQDGDQLLFTFSHQYRPDAGEFQSRIVIARDQDINVPVELQTFGDPDYKVGIVHRIEDDYTQVDVTRDGEQTTEYLSSNLVEAAGIWAGDTVIIETKTEIGPGIIQTTMNVAGNIRSPQEREVDNERKVQEAQDIIDGLDMEAIGRAFPPIIS